MRGRKAGGRLIEGGIAMTGGGMTMRKAPVNAEHSVLMEGADIDGGKPTLMRGCH